MIPKVIHQIWLGGPLPDHLQIYVNTWRDKHPDWVFKWWTDDNLPELPAYIKPLYDRATKLFPDGNMRYQFQSDILRYVILLREGGVYVDTDFECKKPIDDLCDTNFFAWESQDQWVGNAIIGCRADDPLIKKILDGLVTQVYNKRKGDAVSKISGPRYITSILNNMTSFVGWRMWPQKYFYPYLYNELDRITESFPDAYAVHHWNNRRSGIVRANIQNRK